MGEFAGTAIDEPELASETDLATLLELISRLATELLGVGSVAVYLWDEANAVLIPLHWCTFNLAVHAWSEPVERLLRGRHFSWRRV